ncbi:unnamed protein product [Oikopleura dioica]|uniref:Uncharacterized protein n=1 Tax=Oikopleura dioica TaxID=34765 RepID=E4XMW6_OIKDI|nr:unnamed protein product [Oikopleura dioica]
MSKNNKKEGDVFKTPHDAVQNKLDKDFLNQQADYLKKRRENMEEQLDFLRIKNAELKSKHFAEECRYNHQKKTAKTSDLGTSSNGFVFPEIPTFDFNFPSDYTPSVIYQPYTAPNEIQEIALKL